ncbi:transcriptional regulator [Rhodoferax ferrireducens]|uniref:transcriptional regulator n=1 Tax=Rhodoferax ferrireducens TaxID=192843 RepID=UPI000E0DAAFC|nr:YdaS family helix-turn-helix protein [Rhodoferax ferrireducens]
MDKLLIYLNSLNHKDREAFAKRCGTTVGYLRKAISVNQRIGEVLCLRIGLESNGVIKPEDIRPDLDWEYLRTALSGTVHEAPTTIAQAAIKSVAPVVVIPDQLGALRTGVARRHSPRMEKGALVDIDRRSKKIPPFQATETGVA